MRKKCSKCNKEKKLSSFFRDRSNRTGYRPSCKDCDKEIRSKEVGLTSAKKYYKNNKKKILLKHQKYRVNWREKAIKHLGGKCLKCNFSDIRALQIDHINGGGRYDRKHSTIKFLKKVLKDNKRKYQLLCANCNTIKRIENREFGKRVKIYE